jgi:hypothetical protein
LLHSSGSSARQWKDLAGKPGAVAYASDFYGHGTRTADFARHVFDHLEALAGATRQTVMPA